MLTVGIGTYNKKWFTDQFLTHIDVKIKILENNIVRNYNDYFQK